jgi:hypothetical protein
MDHSGVVVQKLKFLNNSNRDCSKKSWYGTNPMNNTKPERGKSRHGPV